MDPQIRLSARERQIMDIVYARSEASATNVLGDLPDALSRASVRTFLRILEDKGHLTHRESGREFIYRPIQARKSVGRSAMSRVVSTFFGGSIEQALAAHLTDPKARLSDDELARLNKLIRQARKEGK